MPSPPTVCMPTNFAIHGRRVSLCRLIVAWRMIYPPRSTACQASALIVHHGVTSDRTVHKPLGAWNVAISRKLDRLQKSSIAIAGGRCTTSHGNAPTSDRRQRARPVVFQTLGFVAGPASPFAAFLKQTPAHPCKPARLQTNGMATSRTKGKVL